MAARRRYVRAPIVRRLLRDMTLLALALLLFQIASLFVFRTSWQQHGSRNPAYYPFMAQQIHTFPSGAQTVAHGGFTHKDSLETIVCYHEGEFITSVVLNSNLVQIKSFLLPENVELKSISATFIDRDSTLDLVYQRSWPAPIKKDSGLDSIQLCYRPLRGNEIVIDRKYAPESEKEWRGRYTLPVDGYGNVSASGISHVAYFFHEERGIDKRDALLLSRRSILPRIHAKIPVANSPRVGFWMPSVRDVEVFTFGGTPHATGSLLPIRVVDQDGGLQNTVLTHNRATLMQVSDGGIVRWVRSFPPSSGFVIPYRVHRDTLFAVHQRTSGLMQVLPSVQLTLLEGLSGTILSFQNYDNMRFASFLHSESISKLPIGLLYRSDSLIVLNDAEAWKTHPITNVEIEKIHLQDRLRLLCNDDQWLFPVQTGADTTWFLNNIGDVQGLTFGTIEPNYIPSHGEDELGDAILPLRLQDDTLLLSKLTPNPDPFWRLRSHIWLLVLIILPHVLLLLLFGSLGFRQARRDARNRLIFAYRRLQARFKRRSEELAAVNRDLEKQSEERKRVLEELQTQREHLDSIFNSVQEGLVTLDQDGVVTRANRSFGDTFSLDPGELPGTPLISLFPDQTESLDKLLTQALHSGKAMEETQIELTVKRQQERKVVRVRTVPLRRHDLPAEEILVILRDETRLVRLEDHIQSRYRFHNLTGQSEKMRQIYTLVEHIATSDATVLVTGESGTGKELVSRALHLQSHRSSGPFVSVHCAALTQTLLESELFGHVKGAFTGATRDKVGYFQKAHHGTLFLDEFGEVSASVQVKLLRVLNDKVIERVGDTTPIPVDVRILIATNRNLGEEVRDGRFREDLYYRINVLAIEMPPLREHREDIPLLVTDLLHNICEELDRKVDHISEDVLSRFMSYPWPGNVRELRNCLERAVIVCKENAIKLEHLPPEIRNFEPSEEYESHEQASLQQVGTLTAGAPDERTEIVRTLNSSGWVVARAARSLGMSRQTLYRKIASLDIQRPVE